MVSLFSNGNVNQTKSSKDKRCSKLFETGMAYFLLGIHSMAGLPVPQKAVTMNLWLAVWI